jgi:transmembrane sensor
MGDGNDKSAVRDCVATEAADWYARLRADHVSELDAVRFRAWIAADPARRREFEAIDALWEDLKAIEKSPEVLREREVIARRREQSGQGAPHRRSLWWASAAAAAVLLVSATGLWFQQRPVDRYSTGIGEQRTVPLADGTVVSLNTATEIRLHFSPQRRDVELVSGQANFEVAKDPARPFVVTAGDRAVRAVGTQFDVYKTSENVIVTLIEGKVAVVPTEPQPVLAVGSAQAGPDEIVLAAGEQLLYRTKAVAVERRSADLPRVEAWRARKLDFNDTPLTEAIAEANRYSATQIVLDAPELKDARISGRFEAGRADLFVEGLQGYFQFHVERTAEHRIVLTPRR